MSVKIEVVSPNASSLGEGPYWDPKSQLLYYVDINGGDAHQLNPRTKEDNKINVGKYVSFIIPRSKGQDEFMIGNDLTIQVLNWKSGQKQDVTRVDQEQPKKVTRLNDAKCDASGRLFTGTMFCMTDESKFEVNQGALYSLDTSRQLRKHLSDISISNGTVWSADNKTMYYIDSIPRTVSAFDYDLNTGEMSNRRVAINLNNYGHEFGLPDGMTMDIEGKVWIACYGGGRIIRCDPQTGKLLRTIEFPASKITSCCFGGPNFTDLYVTSVFHSLSELELKSQPLAGHVFKVTGLETKGLADYPYGG